MHQNAPQPTSPTNPPKIGLFRMRAIYGRLAELRAQLTTLENTPNGN